MGSTPLGTTNTKTSQFQRLRGFSLTFQGAAGLCLLRFCSVLFPFGAVCFEILRQNSKHKFKTFVRPFKAFLVIIDKYIKYAMKMWEQGSQGRRRAIKKPPAPQLSGGLSIIYFLQQAGQPRGYSPPLLCRAGPAGPAVLCTSCRLRRSPGRSGPCRCKSN